MMKMLLIETIVKCTLNFHINIHTSIKFFNSSMKYKSIKVKIYKVKINLKIYKN